MTFEENLQILRNIEEREKELERAERRRERERETAIKRIPAAIAAARIAQDDIEVLTPLHILADTEYQTAKSDIDKYSSSGAPIPNQVYKRFEKAAKRLASLNKRLLTDQEKIDTLSRLLNQAGTNTPTV